MSCSDDPNLCQVLDAGNWTGHHDIHLSRGSKIEGHQVVLEGGSEIDLIAPTIKVAAAGSLTLSTPNLVLDTGSSGSGTVAIRADYLVLEGRRQLTAIADVDASLQVDRDLRETIGRDIAAAVSRDSSLTVGGNTTRYTVGNFTSTCDHGRTYTTHGDVGMQTDGSFTLHNGGPLSSTVDSSRSYVTFGDVVTETRGGVTHHTHGPITKTTDSNNTDVIGGDVSYTCSGRRDVRVSGAQTHTIMGEDTETRYAGYTRINNGPEMKTTVADATHNYQASHTTTVGTNMSITALDLEINAIDQWTINVGPVGAPTTVMHFVPTAATLTTPIFTINGDLAVTGRILSPFPFVIRLSLITAPTVPGGDTVVSPDWTNWPILASHQFSQTGTYLVQGFAKFFAPDTTSISVAQFGSDIGTDPAVLGTSVDGAGLSVFQNRLIITDLAAVWNLQYKSTTARTDGLGRASGLADNIYVEVDIIQIQ